MTTYLTRDNVEVTPVIFGTSCLGNLYRVLPYETKLELVKAWFRTAAKPSIDSAGKYGAGLALETIPYEVLTSVSNRVKRVYFQD